MRDTDVRDIVRSVLCKGLSVAQADQLVKATVPVRVAAGGAVLEEGDPPSGLHLLLRGEVEIKKRGPDGRAQSLGTIGAPTVLGEMSLVTERPHSATITALTDCDFALLTRAQFARLIAGESLAAYKLLATIAEVLAGRVARLDEKVLELTAGKDCPAPVGELAAFQRKLFSEWRF